ncbi:IclR family transcriptional regulator [Bordetella genomosp. 4]|nr:IclR family transcriptional regulator [Bordetella genomosp. 4]
MPADEKPATEDRQFVVALGRGLDVLRCFSAQSRMLGTTDIAGLTGLPQPTVWRLCYTLQKMGYLVAARDRDKLMLGPAALALGAAALAGQEPLEAARPAMQAFADRYRGAVALGQRDQNSIVYLLRCQGDSDLLMNFRVGSRIPLYASAIGGAWIASANEAERRALMKGSADPTWLNDACSQYEQRGFVMLARPAHHINTVATAIVLDGQDRYVLNCGGPASLLPQEFMLQEVGPALLELAAELRSAFAFNRRQV